MGFRNPSPVSIGVLVMKGVCVFVSATATLQNITVGLWKLCPGGNQAELRSEIRSEIAHYDAPFGQVKVKILGKGHNTGNLVRSDLITPSVRAWVDKLALEAPNTGKMYRSSLGRYWLHQLSTKFSTVDAWATQVRNEQVSNDIDERRAWAVNLESFVNSYVSPKTQRHLSPSQRMS